MDAVLDTLLPTLAAEAHRPRKAGEPAPGFDDLLEDAGRPGAGSPAPEEEASAPDGDAAALAASASPDPVEADETASEGETAEKTGTESELPVGDGMADAVEETAETAVPLPAGSTADTEHDPDGVEARDGMRGTPDGGAVAGVAPTSRPDAEPVAVEAVEPPDIGPASEPVPEDDAPSAVDEAETEPTEAPDAAEPVGEDVPGAKAETAPDVTRSETLERPAEIEPAADARIPDAPAAPAAPATDAPAPAEAARPATQPAASVPAQTYEAVAAPVRVLARDGGGEARIHLSPPRLGRVDVTVTVEDGRVRAELAPERPEVARLLIRQVPELRDQLAELGLGVDDVDVNAGGTDDRPDSGRPDGGTAAAPAFSIEDPAAPLEIRSAHIGPDGVDVWA